MGLQKWLDEYGVTKAVLASAKKELAKGDYGIDFSDERAAAMCTGVSTIALLEVIAGHVKAMAKLNEGRTVWMIPSEHVKVLHENLDLLDLARQAVSRLDEETKNEP